MRRKFIGLSLSLCMQDILDHKIEVDEIAAIVTSTAFYNVVEAFDYYYPIYWKDYPDSDVFSKLTEVWPVVCQPRIHSDPYEHRGHYVHKGFWLNTETGELKGHL